MRVRKKELGNWHKNRSEDRAKMLPLPCEVHSEIDKYERAATSKARKIALRNDHIITFGEVFEKSLTSWKSFNIHFATLLALLTLCIAHGRPSQKHMPRLLTVMQRCLFKDH